MRVWCAIGMVFFALHCRAEGVLLKVPTRDGVNTTLFWAAAPAAKATLFLFPGGGGGFGKVEAGKAMSNNFLVRSVPHFLAQGFNVAIFGRPSDSDDLDYADRISAAHMEDVRQVLAVVKSKAALPVWLLGTSRGTISATAAAINLADSVAGLVLTASVVNYKKPGAVPRQDLAAIRLPVLVVHHSKDECVLCRPHEVPGILRGLENAAVKKLVMVDAGENPSGDPCAALHWHGFIGAEAAVVALISDWIKSPTN